MSNIKTTTYTLCFLLEVSVFLCSLGLCMLLFFVVVLFDCSFGDYVSDQVVAPVRETCAQALGVVFKYMHSTLVHETLNILLEMQVNFM